MPRKADGHEPAPESQRARRYVSDAGGAVSGVIPPAMGNRAAKKLLRATAGTGDDDFSPQFDVADTRSPRHAAPASMRHSPIGRSVAAVSQDSAAGHIRRHASWEHKMLGDVDPDTLEIISSGKSVAAEEKKKGGFLASTRASAKTITNESGAAIDLETVLHTIDQEIARLQLFKAAPPMGTVADATKALQEADAERRKGEIEEDGMSVEALAAKKKEIDDAKWDVRLVELTLSDGSGFLVTYGEMNTLADFYGSAAEIAQTPATNFRGILGGVREESLRKFMRLRNELTVTGDKQYKPDDAAHKFEGAIGNKGESYKALGGDAFGELKLMGKMPGWGQSEAREKIGGKEETSYIAGLVRNACHFAPQSWHSWSAAHTKAVALAQESFALTSEVKRVETQRNELRDGVPPGLSEDTRRAIAQSLLLMQARIEELKKQSAAKLNQALIENGFGDHFLQDSYAAGHLINKTQVMQWFAKWLDTKGRKRDYSTEEQWRQIQQIAYGQEAVGGADLYDKKKVGTAASNDPQSVENMEGDWTARFQALGLAIPGVLKTPGTDEFNLFTWWQGQAMDGRLLKADASDLGAGPVKGAALQAALKKLINDGVVYYNWYSTKDRAKGAEQIGVGNKSLRLKKEYIPKKENEAKFKSAVTKAEEGDQSEYNKMAEAVTYSDYHKFLNHGYLQLSSNVLHDYFCANGLDVATAEGETPFKIYGDNAMLNKESAKGVKHSSRTSRMSRDSIYEIAATGATDKSTQSIAARFPTYVTPAGGPQMPLAEWHSGDGPLHKFCFDTVFDDAAAIFAKGTVAAKAELAAKASKDDKVEVHSGEAF